VLFIITITNITNFYEICIIFREIIIDINVIYNDIYAIDIIQEVIPNRYYEVNIVLCLWLVVSVVDFGSLFIFDYVFGEIPPKHTFYKNS
jgi:hypothetical protein